MSKYFVFSLLALCTFINPSLASASTQWESLSANAFLQQVQVSLETSTAIEIKDLSAIYAYKNLKDKNPIFEGTVVEGKFNMSATTPILQYDITSTYEFGKGKKYNTYQMEVISDGVFVYVNFIHTEIAELKDKWIQMTPAQYTKLGEVMGLEGLFNAQKPESLAVAKSKSKESYNIMASSGALENYPFTIEDSYTVPNATRYNFEYTKANIKMLISNITNARAKELSQSDPLVKILIKIQKSESALAAVADNSYMSIWIDNTTNEPVRMVDHFWFAEKSGKKAKPFVGISDTSYKKLSSIAVTAPAKNSLVSYTEAVRLLEL